MLTKTELRILAEELKKNTLLQDTLGAELDRLMTIIDGNNRTDAEVMTAVHNRRLLMRIQNLLETPLQYLD